MPIHVVYYYPLQDPKVISTVSKIPSVLLGGEIIGETIAVVTNQSQLFMWKGYGLTLEIGEGSLPAALQECCIHIKALAPVAVRYNLPDNVSLSSVVYWFQCEPSCCFEKAITLRMHHCAKNEDKSRFCILKANYHCVQSSSFAFEKLEGDFSTRGQGSIKLNSFSLYGTGVEGSDEREYRSTVAYQYGRGLADIHFIVTWNVEPLLTVSTCI